MSDQIDLSIYQPNLNNKYTGDPWSIFNAAAQRRKEREVNLKQETLSQPESDEERRRVLEQVKVDDMLFTAEYQKKNQLDWVDLEAQINDEEYYCPEAEADYDDGKSTESDTAVETDAERETAFQAECVVSAEVEFSDAEITQDEGSSADGVDQYDEEYRDTSSIYDDINEDVASNNNNVVKEDDEESLDYITDTFEIKRINKRLEDAIEYYNRKDVERKGFGDRSFIEKALKEFEAGELSEDKLHSLEKTVAFYNRPSSADRLHFANIRLRRSARKIGFGETRIKTYNVGEVVTKEEHPVKPKHGAPGKSILKNTNVKKFQTPNGDYNLVGTDLLANAIARLFNLSDMPLKFFDKDDPISSLTWAAHGIANAFGLKELCMENVMNGKIEARKKAIKQRDECIKKLQTEKSSLVGEVSELKEKLEKVTTEMNLKTRESREYLDLANNRTRELKRTVGNMEELKIDLIEATSKAETLAVENNDLRKNTKELRANLVEQKETSKSLNAHIRILEKKLVHEQKRLSDSWSKIQSLEQYTKESLKLQSGLQAIDKSNEKLVDENKKLRTLNDRLSVKVKDVEVSLSKIGRSLETSQCNESKLQEANQSLAKEREENHEKIERLEETNHAYRAEFALQFRQLEAKYAEAVKECKIRDKEIRKAERQLEKRAQALRDTGWKMAKKRDDNTVHVYSENMADDGNCVDRRRRNADSDVQVSGGHGHKVLRSLSNKMHVHMSSTDYKLGRY